MRAVVAVAVATVVVAAITVADTAAVSAIVVACVRHIRSRAARVVPDMDMPVVLVGWQVTRDATIADMATVQRR